MAKIASHRFEDYTCVHKLYMDSCGIGQQSNNTFIDCLTFFSLFFYSNVTRTLLYVEIIY